MLERNFKSKRQDGCEIDIIMTKGVVIVFVEVKYRRQGCFSEASYSITGKKKQILYYAAEKYMSLNGIDIFSKCVFLSVLIDDTILGRKISFVENIFL